MTILKSWKKADLSSRQILSLADEQLNAAITTSRPAPLSKPAHDMSTDCRWKFQKRNESNGHVTIVPNTIGTIATCP